MFRILLTSVLIILLTQFQAQTGYVSEFEEILRKSEQEWLCTSFEETYPSYFEYSECPPHFESKAPDTTESLELNLTHDGILEMAVVNIMLRNDCKRFLRTKALSDLYFPLFRKKLESIGLPADYQYLPIVLSGLNSRHQQGERSGLWHLSYVIGKKYGLRIDESIDERRAPDLSTDAALVHLKFLNEKYEGDQHKVLVAFFSSVSMVEQFSRLSEMNEITFNEAMNDRCREFLYTYRIVERLFKNLKTQNALFDYIDLLNQYENLVFSQDVSFEAVSKYIGETEKNLQGMNPAYVGVQIPSMYREVPFIVSKDQAAMINADIDSLYSFDNALAEEQTAKFEKEKEQMSKGIPTGSDMQQSTYRVKSGDVLGVIAERFGVRVSDLRNWNDLNGDRIYAGQTLVVYKKKGSQASNEKPKSDPKPNTQIEQPTGSKPIEYTVQPGESLWLIARKFPGVSADNIMEWNEIDEGIQPGQVLKIYASK